ncbi:MAG: fucose isomerase [Candidatus Thorarchaeota archaeon]|jgi:L-fucose isomerase-like protein
MSLIVVPFFSAIASPCLIDTHTKRLRESGVRIIAAGEYKKLIASKENESIDRLILFIGTGGTEKEVAEFVDEIKLTPPIILLSHQTNNSLPAAMEIRTYLERMGYDSSIVHLPLQGLIDKLSKWREFEQHLDTIRTSKLGLIGSPSYWLIASTVHPESIATRWGMEFKEYDLGVLKEPPLNESQIFKEYSKGASKIEIPEEELKKASDVAQRLDELMDSEGLNAITVQCFDFLNDTSITGCLGLSHINNKSGRVAGCEGDVPSTFTMFLARLLTGSSSFMANVIDVDLENNTATFAHCTVPTTLVKDYEITTHFETDLSVGIRGIFDKQEVTIFKVSGDELLDFWAAAGTITENLRSGDGCRTQIRVDLETGVSYFLESSLANHHIIIPGNHVDLIEDFFSFVYLRE